MIKRIEKLCEHRVFYHFYQISQIPHGSGNEKAISDFILGWSRNLGLEAEQDTYNNLLIRKKASRGLENAPGIMLQAHMDMVCEKDTEVDHDFTKDPIDWVIEGDTLSSGGKTTLGADDGIGVALAMAILEDNALQHPPLEVLFTTMEEEDLSGAENFDTSQMNSVYLFNLDHVNDREILCGSCGGMQADIRIPVTFGTVSEDWRSYRISVSGLKGGHSGEDIHRGHGNANILLARMLMAIESCCDFRLGYIQGGSFRLAIPREAEAVVWLDPANSESVRLKLSELETDIRAELAVTSQNVKVSISPVKADPWGIEPACAINALVLVPDGIYQMNEMLTGLVDTSDNLGEVYLSEQELHFVIEIRSARNSLRTYLFQRMERLASLLGGTCHGSNAYPSWEFHPKSELRELCGRIYEENYHEKPAFLTVHAGLEVGCLSATRPNIDAVSIGADCWDFHSPSETVRISSVKKVFEYLCKVLAKIR
ncbi:beta-Ala-His dipeptidase [Faecalispora anaeroviscerum]|uniref:beta-Ala-His dipeptidase n=1 Tax=Faecalispora anaeroviscerum TaxID=2991836 RepID=UPI0024BA9D05|nr:beta-Ala-His dipeptidase [Faecalispora anaeroviscerum]